MLAWHVDAVLVLIAADHASIRVAFLTDQGHLDLADVGLVCADLEDRLVLDHKQFAGVALEGQSLPRAIGRAHVLDVVLAICVCDGGMEVAQVLVVLEVQQVVGLATNGHLGLRDLYDCIVSRAFNDGQTQVSIC